MPEEQPPLGLEAVAELGVVRHLLPLVAEASAAGTSGFQTGLGVADLCCTRHPRKPGDGRTLGAVDLELDEFVAVDAHGPGGVDLGDHSAFHSKTP